MRSGVRILAAACLLALGACTGTFEVRPPILLAVAFDDGTPQLALVRDNFATGPSGTPRELTFLESSRRILPAPAIAFDVVDRAGARDALIVLSRESSAPHTAYLRGYDLDRIDPEDPVGFAEDPDYARDLTALLRDQPELPDEADYCPVDLQISSSGRYLVLLEHRAACGGDDLAALYVLDLDRDRLVAAVDTEPLVAAGIHLDQQADRVYFVVEGVGNATLEAIDVASGDRSVIADLTGRQQVDLGPVAPPPGEEGGTLLVALSGSSFQALDLDLPDPEASPPVDTESGAHVLIDDPFGRSQKVLVLGGSRFTVHQSVEDEEERSASVTAAGATFQPEDLFVYLASEGRIFIYDALVDSGNGSPTLAPFTLPALISPGPITWMRGADTPAP